MTYNVFSGTLNPTHFTSLYTQLCDVQRLCAHLCLDSYEPAAMWMADLFHKLPLASHILCQHQVTRLGHGGTGM